MPSGFDRNAQIGVAGAGVGMVVVSVAAGLAEGLAITFAVLGAGLISLGGLAHKLKHARVGPSGFEAEFRETLVGVQKVAEEEHRDDLAEAIGEVVETVDKAWFDTYKRRVRESPGLDPFSRAALLQQTWQLAQARVL